MELKELRDFRWEDIKPETMPAFPSLPDNLATKEDVAIAKKEVESELSEQSAIIGKQILDSVGAEQIVNDAIKATVDLNATKLIELQTEVSRDLTSKIESTNASLSLVKEQVGMVDSKVAMVDTRVSDAAKTTSIQFAQVGATISDVKSGLDNTNNALSLTNSTLGSVVSDNESQTLVLTELVKAATNTREVITVFLDSIN
jgi:hypothetical protein